MGVVVDLEDESSDPQLEREGSRRLGRLLSNVSTASTQSAKRSECGQPKLDPNQGGFSAVLTCYPVVEELAKSLDLNTLSDLSRTCRLFRANLLQYRRQLIAKALRCINDDQSAGTGVLVPSQNNQRVWHIYGYNNGQSRLTSGKIGPCARDYVRECQRCGYVVCRNCTTKPPSAAVLPNRLRRLCKTCARASLPDLVGPHVSSTNGRQAFTYKAFIREPCSCTESVFICRPCGRAIANDDIDYKRIWTWRTRYSNYLGGLGTGIGEGNEGVKCARGEHCLDARNIEVEVDCDSTTPDDMQPRPGSQQSSINGAAIHDVNGEGEKAGYFRQEMEGIGGIVRGKYKKIVRVGRTVKEHEDERETGEYLGREARRECRSWCGWCDRVVPGKLDRPL